MEDILLQRSGAQAVSNEPLTADAHKAGNHLRTRLSSFKADSNLNWGRSHNGSLSTAIHCTSIMLLCPVLVIFTWVALEDFGGSLVAAFSQLLLMGPFEFAAQYAPSVSGSAVAGYTSWLLFQAALYTFLPSKLSTGQLTPAGYLLQYYTNGLLAWVVAHVAFVVAVLYGLLNPAIIATNWAGLLVAANIYGFLLSAFAYYKAHYFPTHAEDRKFSGERIGHMIVNRMLTLRRL
jgi:7-dehydrocholesterol reductase